MTDASRPVDAPRIREVLRRYREEMLSAGCRTDETGRPILHTLDEEYRTDLAELDALLRDLDAQGAAKRDRPAKEPGGCECQECGRIFIGAEWHTKCAVCVDAQGLAPAGWRLVPETPTPDMLTAGAANLHPRRRKRVYDIYTAMLAAAPASPSPALDAPTAWRCYHCDEVFTDAECAKEHFGEYEDCLPACKIGAEQFRKMESELQDWRSQNDSATKEFYSLGADHDRKVRRAEQEGYDKGLADGRASAIRAAREGAAHG